jgi:hypothetical protein
MTEEIRPTLREAPYSYTLGLVPGLREALAQFGDTLWSPDGRVSLRARELVFLRTSIVNQCET